MDPPSVSERARVEPDRPAFVLGDHVRTYGGYDERTTRLAHALRRLGIGPGGRVAIMLPNGFEFFETWAAATKLQASVVLVNWHLKADELGYILVDSGASLLVADPELDDRYERALLGAPQCSLLTTGLEYEAAITGEGAAAADEPMELIGLGGPIFYTSGTTGRPKGVVHGTGAPDPATMRRNMQGQVALWGWTADDVYIVTGPAYHAGPGGWTMTALAIGATTVIQPSFDAREWLRLVERHRVTRTFCVPAHFIRLLEVPDELAARDHSSLQLIVHAGAPCPVPVKRRIIEALAPCEISELYGMSEGGATRISMQEWLERPGSVGLPWPGTEVRILDGTGDPAPSGETGVIFVRPPGGLRFHYHDDEARTDAAWRADAFTVGDVGHLDKDGYLYLTDRAVDMVIRGGVNIYPREIEDVLYTHPAVVDCAVFGVPDERMGEELMAVVEVREPVTPDALREHCRTHLANFKVPATIELVDELPRQPNGKVLKRLLREQHWKDRPTAIG
jgi:long-chain acyl-CoA synthetase